MLSDRRPILLTNARIVDPSRDLDFPGDLLLADGVIREAKRGIGAGGVPEGTEVIDCHGKLVAPGLIDMRAFIGEPGAEPSRDVRFGEPGGGRWRRHHRHLRSRTPRRRSTIRPPSISCCGVPAIPHRPCASDGSADKRSRRQRDDRDRPVEGRRRRRLHRRRPQCHQRAGDAPRAYLCARFRCA